MRFFFSFYEELINKKIFFWTMFAPSSHKNKRSVLVFFGCVSSFLFDIDVGDGMIVVI